MPVNMNADFLLDGKPFMLWRDKNGARAWKRERIPDSLTTQRRLWKSINEPEVFGGLPDDIDHPEIWDDWSGGFGRYREVDKGNHFHAGFGVDTRFPGSTFLAQLPQPIPAPQAAMSKNVTFLLDVPLPSSSPPAGSGEVLALGLGYYGQFTPTSPNTFDSLQEAAPSGGTFAFGYRAVLAGSFVYIPNLMATGFFQRTLDGASFLQTTINAQAFTVQAGRLWRAYQNNLFSCPITSDVTVSANWSAAIPIGNGKLSIADLYAFEDHVFAGMPDGLYMGDLTGTFTNVTTEIGAAVDIDNVRDLSAHNGGVVFEAGESVWWYKPSSGANSELRQLWPVVDVRPFATPAGNPVLWDGTPVGGLSLKGKITALQGHGQFLYAGVFTGSVSALFAGVDASGAGPYVWHPMQVFPGAKISRIHVDQISTTSGGLPVPQRLWVAMDASFGARTNCTSGLYFWPIPKANGNPLSDPTFSPNYYPYGIVEQSLTDSAVPTIWKLWRKMETLLEGAGGSLAADCVASTSVQVAALMDGTMFSTFDASTYVRKPKDYHYFTNANNDAVAQQARVSLRLNSGFTWTGNGWTGSSGTTPVVRAIAGHNVFRPRIAEQITAKVRIADLITDRQGNEMRPGANMLDELDTMSRASNQFPLTDLVGRTFPVIVMPGVDQEEAYQVGSDYPEIQATVKLGVIDASWSAAPTVPFHPDGG